ncbi:hypothetical protein FJZ53_03755 [Candidatus Woesearchaeota archaeon]|nr:hypothetical protein [Candidatus Woesearchaeota archaeon]
MSNLLARLNTSESLAVATAEKKRYGQGIYVNFGEESEIYKSGTFKKVIDSIVEQALGSEDQKYQEIANGVRDKISQQGPSKELQILVYDPKTGQNLRNVNNEGSMVMGLDDKVKEYIIERDIENGEETCKVDYLDIVVRLNPAVGGK